MAVIYAHKALISNYISTLGDLEKAQQALDENKDDENDQEGDGSDL